MSGKPPEPMSSERILRAAVLGCGEVAEWLHLPVQRVLPQVSTVAVADLDRARAEEMGSRFSVPTTYGDYETLLNTEEIDFVTVCLPPALHRDAIEAAAARGINVLCEKPMAPTWRDVECIQRVIETSGVKFMVSQNFRWHPDVVTASRELRAGAIGDIFHVRVEEFVREEDTTYRRSQKRFVLLEHGVHYLDLLRYLVQDEVERVHAVTRAIPVQDVAGENLVSITLEFRGGVVGRVDNCVCTTRGGQSVLRLRVDGTRGVLLLNTPDAPIKIYSDRDGGGWIVPRSGSRLSSALPAEEWPWPMAELRMGVEGVYRAFCSYLQGGEEPPSTASENAKTMALVFAAYQSAEEGRVVQLG
jgi:predicted dehydrogenase